MPLPRVYSELLAADHVAAVQTGIAVSLDHAIEDLVILHLGREPHWDEFIFLNGLPHMYRDSYTLLFAKKFVACLTVATQKMAAPNVQPGMLACVAEELAAHLVLRKAEAVLASRSESREMPEGEAGFAPVYDLLFEDLDFEMLYDPAVNGIERNPAAEQALGLANLRFDDWFEPFPGRHVHPICASDSGRHDRGIL